MREFHARRLGLAALGLISIATATTAHAADGARDFDVQWTVEVKDVPPQSREAKVWIAIPQELPAQRVQDLKVHTDYAWTLVEDPDYHNTVVEVTVPDPPTNFSIDLSAKVHRLPVNGPVPAKLGEADEKLYLREEALVSLSPRMHAIADSLPDEHRARYDYVLDLMTYDKVAPGWGKGDSERACDVRKGNCTDFHSLFMSLSRAQNVLMRSDAHT